MLQWANQDVCVNQARSYITCAQAKFGNSFTPAEYAQYGQGFYQDCMQSFYSTYTFPVPSGQLTSSDVSQNSATWAKSPAYTCDQIKAMQCSYLPPDQAAKDPQCAPSTSKSS